MVGPVRAPALILLLASVAGCSSGPPGPTLPQTLTIEPSGEARSACRRQILTDVERRGELSREQLVELVTRVDAWTAKVGDLPPAAGKHQGSIAYGTKKAAWEKDASLPPELDALVKFLLTIPPTLRVESRRR